MLTEAMVLAGLCEEESGRKRESGLGTVRAGTWSQESKDAGGAGVQRKAVTLGILETSHRHLITHV